MMDEQDLQKIWLRVIEMTIPVNSQTLTAEVKLFTNTELRQITAFTELGAQGNILLIHHS